MRDKVMSPEETVAVMAEKILPTPAISRSMSVEDVAAWMVEAGILDVLKERDAAKTSRSCGTCGGTPHVSGIVCVCAGTGDAAVEAQGLRDILAAKDKRIARLIQDTYNRYGLCPHGNYPVGNNAALICCGCAEALDALLAEPAARSEDKP